MLSNQYEYATVVINEHIIFAADILGLDLQATIKKYFQLLHQSFIIRRLN